MKLRQTFYRIVSRERGSALVAAVIFSAIIAIVAAYAYRSTVFQRRIADRSQDYLAALAVAEAGAELAMVELNTPDTAAPAPFDGWTGASTKALTEDITDKDGNLVGEVVVEVSKLDTTGPLVVATGHIPSVKNSKIARTVQLVTESDKVPSPFGSFGIFGYDSVTMNGSQVVDSYDAESGQNGTKSATVGSLGDIKFGGSSVVRGSMQAGGTIKMPGASVVTGEKVEKSSPTPPPPLPKPEYDPDPPVANDNANIDWRDMFGNRKTIPSNRNISVTGIGSVTLPAPGVYHLNSLSFSGSTNLSILGDGEVTIYADQSFDASGAQSIKVQGDSKVTLISPTVNLQGSGVFDLKDGADLTVISDVVKLAGARNMAFGPDSNAVFYVKEGLTLNGSSSINANGKPSQFQIFAEGDVTFNGSSTYRGGLYAPNADLTVNGAATWAGAMIAKKITVNGSSSVIVEESILQPTMGDGVYVNAWLEAKVRK